MVTQFNLVFSASAVVRILSLSVHAAQVRVEQWWKVCFVRIPGQRPTFISKKRFYQEFVSFRKNAARRLICTKRLDIPGAWGVRNEEKDSLYVVQPSTNGLVCQCEDYKNQMQFLGKGCCKHGYAVLNKLGFDSLENYLRAFQPGGYLRDPKFAAARELEEARNAPLAPRKKAQTVRGISIE